MSKPTKAPIVQRSVDFRLGKNRIKPNHQFLALLLLTLDLWQEHFVPTPRTLRNAAWGIAQMFLNKSNEAEALVQRAYMIRPSSELTYDR